MKVGLKAAWSAGVSIVVFWGQVLASTNPDTITDWRTFLLAGGLGLLTAVAIHFGIVPKPASPPSD